MLRAPPYPDSYGDKPGHDTGGDIRAASPYFNPMGTDPYVSRPKGRQAPLACRSITHPKE
jgi:hypothetical protein